LAAFVGILSALNALGNPIISSVTELGAPTAALNLFGISAVIGFAIVSLERISAADGVSESLRPFDTPIFAAVCGAALVPVGLASGLALFGLGLWLLLSSDPSSRSRRIGVVLLALSGPFVWGKVAIILFGEQLLSWDARLVGALAGSPVDGNIVRFNGRPTAFYVGAGCSSLHHLTLATVLWASVTKLLGKPVTRGSLLLCVAAIVGVVLVNSLRLAAIATYPDRFDALHNGWLALAFGWAALLVAGCIVTLGTVRAART
jgi:exosortase/archaeosortase family protein